MKYTLLNKNFIQIFHNLGYIIYDTFHKTTIASCLGCDKVHFLKIILCTANISKAGLW